jgi:hypothetical protein
MKGFFNMLELLGNATGSSYSSYYADVKDESYKLFNKYELKFGGAARSQRASQPSAHSSKRKQAWGRIFGGPGASPACSPHLLLLHFDLVSVSSQFTWTVTLSHVMMNPLTYCSGGMTIS